MSAPDCAQHQRMRTNLTRFRHDLSRVARSATRPGARGENAQALIPEARSKVDEMRLEMARHEATCEACQQAGVSA